jgi:hypothetical protein
MKKKKIITLLLHTLIWVSLYYIFIRNVRMIGVIEHSHPYFAVAVFICSVFNAGLFYGVSHYILPKFAKGLSALKVLAWCITVLLVFSFIETLLDYSFFLKNDEASTRDYIGQ